MKNTISRVAIVIALLAPGTAALASGTPAKSKPKTAWEASQEHDDNATISTGVAKARDPLNSATSTSVLKEPDIRRLGTPSLAEVLRTVPGIRVEEETNEVGNSYSIRGLPLVGDGAKYIQLQEDGLPTLEFGDVSVVMADTFLRNDLNLGSIESIRGGSASTFASDAPGGVINFISKTGEVEGGSIMLSTGLELGTKRIDADYGGHIGSDWRFHVGGFYRRGEGPRRVGYDAYHGGQIKFNVTREFAGGYVRFSVKVLDDHARTPLSTVPMAITGTGTDPHYSSLPGFSALNDAASSRYLGRFPVLDPNGRVQIADLQNGEHIKSLAFGLETQFQVAGWTVSDRFRYSRNSEQISGNPTVIVMPATALSTTFGGAGATATYFSGPHAGQPVGALPNGNGALMVDGGIAYNFHNLDLVVNDLRASRVYAAGGGELTLTGGLYAAHQSLGSDKALATLIQDAAGGGNSGLVDLTRNGTAITQAGVLAFASIGPAGNLSRRNVGYTILAPYASINFHKGAIAIGGSLRYDTTAARGTAASDGTGNVEFFDFDGNGVPSSVAETKTAFIPANAPNQVHYNTHKISWSTGVNWRIAEDFAAFARYSSGGRNGADRILTRAFIDLNTGALVNPQAARDSVRQTEAGLKFRRPGLTVNLTGFYATASETNSQIITTPTSVSITVLHQAYKAYGAEFEAAVRHGPFSLNAGATLTHAEISAATNHPELVGNRPRHQPKLIWQLTPQFENDLVTVGASLVGTTSSFSQDVNLLKVPGYTTVALFARLRPVERVELGVNVSNVFNRLAIVSVLDGKMPATGMVLGQTLAGRRATASVRFFF